MRPRKALLVGIWVLFLLPPAGCSEAEPQGQSDPSYISYFNLLTKGSDAKEESLQQIDRTWHGSSPAMLLEAIQFTRNSSVAESVFRILGRKSGEAIPPNRDAWLRWTWSQPYEPHPDYAAFKADLYARRDPRFREYFEHTDNAAIRLDEICWGGVRRDGIPPLDDPKMMTADEVGWLEDSNIVFGVSLNGEARCYPKRILAWHEMFKDTIGGESVCGVYCTLCGSLIIYLTEFEGQHYELGTSGFLYRSNKLMYDHETRSLWSTVTGEPVVGPLVDRGIKLERRYVVTTTWKEWRERHPQTLVLSLETGHDRDYGEGVAYSRYFASDDLMFPVPELDDRLPNKAPVLALRHDDLQLAIDTEYLRTHDVYHDELGELRFVVLTDESGACRVFESAGMEFTKWDGKSSVKSSDGATWTLTEDALVDESGHRLERIPAHRAFWFGWFAQYPETRLVK